MGGSPQSTNKLVVSCINGVETPSIRLSHAQVAVWVVDTSESESGEDWNIELLLMGEPPVCWMSLRSMTYMRRIWETSGWRGVTVRL